MMWVGMTLLFFPIADEKAVSHISKDLDWRISKVHVDKIMVVTVNSRKMKTVVGGHVDSIAGIVLSRFICFS